MVSERHRAGVLGLGCPMHGELARPASPHEVGEGALTAVCPPAGPNLRPLNRMIVVVVVVVVVALVVVVVVVLETRT